MCYLSKNSYEAGVAAVTALYTSKRAAAVAKARQENPDKQKKFDEDVAAKTEKYNADRQAAREKRAEVRAASRAQAEAADADGDDETAEVKVAKAKLQAAQDAQEDADDEAEAKAIFNAEMKVLKNAHAQACEPPTTTVTRLESIQACRSSFAQLVHPTIFMQSPATIIDVNMPNFTSNPDDLTNHFSWLYIAEFTVKSAYPESTGSTDIVVTIELTTDHIAECIALLPWQKIEMLHQYLMKPIQTYVFLDHNYQWTKVGADLDVQKGLHYVEIWNSSARVQFLGEPHLIPKVDFKAVPQVEIRVQDTNKYDPSNNFFVQKAALKVALEIMDAHKRGDAHLGDEADTTYIRKRMQDLQAEYVSSKGVKKNPIYSICQYTARPFNMLNYDQDLQIALMDIDFALINVRPGKDADYAKMQSDARATKAAKAQARRDLLAKRLADDDTSPLPEEEVDEEEDPIFAVHALSEKDTHVQVFIPVEYLSSAVFLVDSKWCKVHPFQDKINGDLYVIGRKSGDVVDEFEVEFLHDIKRCSPNDLILAPNVKVYDVERKKRLSQSSVPCSLM